jgi:hypothetical protein
MKWLTLRYTVRVVCGGHQVQIPVANHLSRELFVFNSPLVNAMLFPAIFLLNHHHHPTINHWTLYALSNSECRSVAYSTPVLDGGSNQVRISGQRPRLSWLTPSWIFPTITSKCWDSILKQATTTCPTSSVHHSQCPRYAVLLVCSSWLTKHRYITLKLNSVAFSPQANYTDRATAACRRS